MSSGVEEHGSKSVVMEVGCCGGVGGYTEHSNSENKTAGDFSLSYMARLISTC